VQVILYYIIIITKADKPIATPMRRYSQVEHTEIASQTKSMLNKGVIKNSTSLWAVLVVLAKKKDDTWQFCIDYCGFNNVTVRDVYPLPRIDDALDALAGA
jgi:hypothetical protein